MDFFIGESCLTARTVVDREILLIGESLFEELEKDPLSPAVIVRICRIDHPRPVIGESEILELLGEGRYILGCRDGRMSPSLDRIVLGRESESIESHRMEDIVPLRMVVSRDDIGRCVSLRMPDMKSRSRRIGEHVEDIFFWANLSSCQTSLLSWILRLECFLFCPELLPLLLE